MEFQYSLHTNQMHFNSFPIPRFPFCISFRVYILDSLTRYDVRTRFRSLAARNAAGLDPAILPAPRHQQPAATSFQTCPRPYPASGNLE